MKVAVVPQWEATFDGELFNVPDEYDPLLPAGPERAFYGHMKEKFERDGHTIDTVDRIGVGEADVVLFIGFREGFEYYQEAVSQSSRPYLVYVAREPPVYTPQHSEKNLVKLGSYFDLVFTWIDSLVDGETFHKYHWPVTESQLAVADFDEGAAFEDRKLLTNISSKTSSPHVDELYSERERVVRFYDDNYPDEFTQYGRNWDGDLTSVDICKERWKIPNYRVYNGEVASKTDAYRKHRFALSFENMTGINGWVSEKIFDVFAAGIIPVYWGASNIEEYVPKNTFIDYRDFGYPSDLHEYLASMDEEEYMTYLSAIDEFLSNGARKFASENVANTFHQAITGLVDTQSPQPISDTEFIDELERSYRGNEITYSRTVSESVRAFMDPPAGLGRMDVTRKFVKAAYNEFLGSR